MDLNNYYPFLSVLNTDLLLQNRNDLIALGRTLDAIIGSTTQFNELACVPHGPPNLQVVVTSGEIYSQQEVSPNAYGGADGLAIDTDLIVKQGILDDPVTLNCPAPATVGFSIDYLVQFAFQETDTDSQNRAFYNPADIPPNFTLTENMLRADTCVVTVKAGVAATTGTQVPPAPDVGYTGAYVVTVAQGQATINSGDIAIYSGAPFLAEKLKDKISLATGDARYARISGAIPTGTVLEWGGPIVNIPSAFLLCGPNYSRATYPALFNAVTYTESGTTTNGANTVTGLSDTSEMFIGMALTGTGIPNGTTIASVAGSSVTMSANATASATVTIRFYPQGAGDGTTTFGTTDKAGRSPIGAGTGSGLTARIAGQSGGEEAHALTGGENGTHTHVATTTTDPHDHEQFGNSLGFDINNTGGTNTVLNALPNVNVSSTAVTATTTIANSGSSTAHNTMHPFRAVNYMIKT